MSGLGGISFVTKDYVTTDTETVYCRQERMILSCCRQERMIPLLLSSVGLVSEAIKSGNYKTKQPDSIPSSGQF